MLKALSLENIAIGHGFVLLVPGFVVLLLYWHDMQAFGGLGDFLGSDVGLWLTIGALAAIVAVAIERGADHSR